MINSVSYFASSPNIKPYSGNQKELLLHIFQADDPQAAKATSNEDHY